MLHSNKFSLQIGQIYSLIANLSIKTPIIRDLTAFI